MFNRGIEAEFKKRFKSPIRELLIVRGARQVGQDKRTAFLNPLKYQDRG